MTIWITLPSGDEEVLEKLPDRFIEKSLQDVLRNANKSNDKEKENDGSSRSNDTSNVELEYPLSKLVALVKK